MLPSRRWASATIAAASHATLRPRRLPASALSLLAQATKAHSLFRDFSTSPRTSQAASSPISSPQTVTEKIVQRYSVGLPPGKKVQSGDYVTLQPHKIMTHDNTMPVALKFMSIGATKIHDPRQLIFTIDHDVQNLSETNQTKYRKIAEFARIHGITARPPGWGIGHQIMVEEGFAWPGTLCVASDSHSNHYGSLGLIGTPVVRTDAASIWATGRTWWCIPPVAKVTFTGTLPVGVTGKDVIVALCGLFNKDEVLNHAIEFVGSEATMRSIPIDDRMTIANMTTEWGALTGMFPIDSVLESWLRARATRDAMLRDADPSLPPSEFTHERIDELVQNPLRADPGAKYAKSLYLDLSTLRPFVAGPNSVKVINPVTDLEAQDIKVDRAYLVSCTNSRSSDIAAAARVFRNAAAEGQPIPRIAEGVKFYIAAASMAEQKMAEEQGDWQVLLDAGATPLPSGCGPCIGLGTGLLEPGEVGISASNRNFKGRMGSTEAKAYLASPEVVAASALSGRIADPGFYAKPAGLPTDKVLLGEGEGNLEQDRARSVEDALDRLVSEVDSIVADAEKGLAAVAEGGKPTGDTSPAAAADAGEAETETLTEILPGFPERVEGEIVFCDADNINTDGIYPGKYTYKDDVPVETMAEVCMENYDPEFRHIARAGDILVAGFNFGCGSSREQAATAILAKQIPLVVAGSFGNIFSRNSINNALMGVEVPRLVQRLREAFPSAAGGGQDGGKAQATRRTGWAFAWDVARSTVTVTEGPGGATWSQKVGELPPNVQEIIAKGGLEKWVKSQIAA